MMVSISRVWKPAIAVAFITALTLSSAGLAYYPWQALGPGTGQYWMGPQAMWQTQLNNFAAQMQLNAEQAQTESNMHYATPYSLPAGTPMYNYGDLHVINGYGELNR